MKKLSTTLIYILSCLTLIAQTNVIYPAPESDTDTRFSDLLEILRTSLVKTEDKYGSFSMAPTKVVINETRQKVYLQNGNHGLNIWWSSTSIDKEEQFIPIRIPLHKGLLGYRISFIQKENQSYIDNIKTLDELKKVTIGQGLGWGDVEVYEANGLNVIVSTYVSLFKMVNAGRFDMFPRGLGEIFQEFDANKDTLPNLTIEKKLLIYYPWPYYFFFNKKDSALAERIEEGIRIMIKDGSFDKIFMEYNNKDIERANLKGRRIIRISNPLLPDSVPVNEKSLWFDPVKY